MGSLFSQLNRESSAKTPNACAHGEILGDAATLVRHPNRSSHRDFGKDVHAADLGGNAIIRPFLLDTNNRGLAADPALFAGGKLRGKDQNQLHLSALLHFRTGIEENSVGADVAGLSIV